MESGGQPNDGVPDGCSFLLRRLQLDGVARLGLKASVFVSADLFKQSQLGLEEIDMVLLVLEEVIEQRPRPEIAGGAADIARLQIGGARFAFTREVRCQHLFHALTDTQPVELLHVGQAIEEEDAIGQPVGMPHLLNRGLALVLG